MLPLCAPFLHACLRLPCLPELSDEVELLWPVPVSASRLGPRCALHAVDAASGAPMCRPQIHFLPALHPSPQVLSGMDYYFGVSNLTGIVNDTLTANVEGYDPQLAEAILHQLTGSNITEVLVRAEVSQWVGWWWWVAAGGRDVFECLVWVS